MGARAADRESRSDTEDPTRAVSPAPEASHTPVARPEPAAGPATPPVRVVESEELPAPTPALRLAAKWARHRKDGTGWGWGVFGAGGKEPIVRIHHGSVPIFVRDLGKCLMVLGVIDVPEEVREKLRDASGGEREDFLHGLREELMQCPRLGYAFAPSPLREAGQLTRVAIDQTLQVAEDDAASFNRFCDAIQETETILLGTAEYLRRFLLRSAESAVYSSSSSPPTGLYL